MKNLAAGAETFAPYGECLAPVFDGDLLQGIEILLDVGPRETVAGLLQPAIKFLPDDQGQETAEDVTPDGLIQLMEDGPGALLPHKDTLCLHLQKRYGELFGSTFDFLFYDITSTYFEGSAKGNAQAKRGYSRDSLSDCPQVCIGLVATREGLPLAFEIFDGNRVDVTTTREMVQIMEAKYGKANRVWVMDRGMVSEKNLEFMRKTGARYLLGTPKSMLKKFERELLEQKWEEVQPAR